MWINLFEHPWMYGVGENLSGIRYKRETVSLVRGLKSVWSPVSGAAVSKNVFLEQVLGIRYFHRESDGVVNLMEWWYELATE